MNTTVLLEQLSHRTVSCLTNGHRPEQMSLLVPLICRTDMKQGWLDVLLYVMTRRVLIFTREPPRREDFGFDTLGFKASGVPGFFGTTTVIEGGKYGASEPRDIWGRRKARAVQTRHSDEDFFANPPADNTIVTKTTVEVSTGPMPPQYADSDFISVIEMDDRPPRNLTPTRANSKWPESDTEEQSRKS